MLRRIMKVTICICSDVHGWAADPPKGSGTAAPVPAVGADPMLPGKPVPALRARNLGLYPPPQH